MECPADSTWLRLLGVIGVERFVASSGFGYDFVCHVGDIAEFSGPVVINYSEQNSLFGQVMREGTVRKAEGRACAAGVTLDGFYAWRGLRRPDGASAARMGLLATSRYHAGR